MLMSDLVLSSLHDCSLQQFPRYVSIFLLNVSFAIFYIHNSSSLQQLTALWIVFMYQIYLPLVATIITGTVLITHETSMLFAASSQCGIIGKVIFIILVPSAKYTVLAAFNKL